MQAIVYYAPGDIRVEDIQKPTMQDGEILVHVDACAVCGTDLKSKFHGNPRIRAPLVMGHEFTGKIESVGDMVVGNWNVGDRVVMATSISCGNCYYCQMGHRNLCVKLSAMGFSHSGGMAEYVAIPENAIENGHLIKVPMSVEAHCAALAEPTSCAVNSISQCYMRRNDNVLIMGAGPMGLLNGVVAQAYGAGKVIISEVNELRRRQCEQFGFTSVVDPTTQDLGLIIRQETASIGVDIVVVTAPAARPQEEAMAYVRKQGTVVLFASLPVEQKNITIDSRLLHYNELHLIGSSDSSPEHVKKAVEFIAKKKIPTEKIVSHQLPLCEINKAFELMQSGEALRVVLIPPK
jgi:L-iditol 2-dehydrogenase